MDQRTLAAKIKQLSKVVAENEPASVIVTLIEDLRDSSSPTEDILRATKAGVIIGKLRSHGSKEVKVAASEVVNKWKKSVESAKQGKNRSAASPGTPSASASPAPPSTASSKKFTGNTETRKFDSEGVDVRRTGSKVRDNSIGLIYNGLAFRSTEAPDAVLEKAVAVEVAAHEKYGESQTYKEKIRSLFQNLKNKSNRELGRKVMSGEVKPSRFVVMSHDELKSADLKEKEKELEKENMKKAQVPMAEKSISTALTCGKCGQKKVSYSQAQTRSADEPMTTFCECTICGNRWKFS